MKPHPYSTVILESEFRRRQRHSAYVGMICAIWILGAIAFIAWMVNQ